MPRTRVCRVLFAFVFLCTTGTPAWPHGKAGKRLFIEPLVTEDANPKNELVFPVFQAIQNLDGHSLSFGYSFEKRLTPNFSVTFENSIESFRPVGQPHVTGFGNVGFGAKYAFFRNAPHETVVSVGLDWELPTGNPRLGADTFHTLTPEILYGKGFGDLPSSGFRKWLRPLAIQGDFTANFPIGAPAGSNPQPNADFVVEYSIPYLNAFVRRSNSGYELEDGQIRKGWSLKAIAGDLVPFAEFNFSWIGEAGGGLHPQGFVRPGIVYMGHYFELGGAAVRPLNSFSGRSTGGMAIFDLFVDDIFPKLGHLIRN